MYETYVVVELAAEAGWHNERADKSHIQTQRPESRELRLGAMTDVRLVLMEIVLEEVLVLVANTPGPATLLVVTIPKACDPTHALSQHVCLGFGEQ